VTTPGLDTPHTIPLAFDLWSDERALPSALDEFHRSWLTESGLLTIRMRCETGRPAILTVRDERVGFLNAAQQSLLEVKSSGCFVREVELGIGATAWIFAQTLVPDPTLEVHSWLAALGSCSLGETLAGLPGIERGELEFAQLPASHPLAARALLNLELAPAALWARRSVYALRGRKFLVQEVLLPALGRA
jgi:chorismate--pyruvate lyase